MGLSRGVELATDAQFKELSNFSTPARAGRILAIESSGQVRVEADDPEGGDVLAWPLNGFVYAVGDVVYVDFAVNNPDSALVIGSKGVTPRREGAFWGARVYNNADISVPNGTLTALTFNSELFDAGGFHSTSVNTGRLTAPVAGNYLITGHVQIAFHATGSRHLYVRHNGSSYIAGLSMAQSGATQYLSVSTVYALAAGEYVELLVLQDSGGALNVQVSAIPPALSMSLLSG